MACWNEVSNSDLALAHKPHPEFEGAERAAIARQGHNPKPHPLEINVARVKHCSILAPSVLCSPLFREKDLNADREKRSGRKRCMPWLMIE